MVEDPLAAMQSLATAWRRELGATVIGITGSVGKTSVKDITRALMPGAVHASSENFNTEIGLPLTILSAPAGTETLVLEMAMRGPGQIAELASIAEPDVGVITIVGPVHLELLGSIEAIAAAKAELIGGLRPGSPVIVPVDAGYLEPHLEGVSGVVRFGDGGAVHAEDVDAARVRPGQRSSPRPVLRNSSSHSPRPTTSRTPSRRSRPPYRPGSRLRTWPHGPARSRSRS